MRVVVQKCDGASVTIDGKQVSKIEKGLMILVGFTHTDTQKDIDYIVKKIINLRIFEDESGVMNKSVIDEKGSILCVSQFTLYANTKKGNRPSYIDAMKSDEAINYYNTFCDRLNEYVETKMGIFGADMKVALVNNGPTTIIIDSK
ncbi:MAG: D-tyrosyl-tRNA(Tyr) deacylase [Bacilli bacterium]|nr:D-tyrosyl-tRNA(Tyr) deacylase [Bacilli bacterium]